MSDDANEIPDASEMAPASRESPPIAPPPDPVARKAPLRSLEELVEEAEYLVVVDETMANSADGTTDVDVVSDDLAVFLAGLGQHPSDDVVRLSKLMYQSGAHDGRALGLQIAATLGRDNPFAGKVMPMVLTSLATSDAHVAIAAIRCLADLDPVAAYREIKGVKAHRERLVRLAAVQVLIKLGTADAIDILVAFCDDTDSEVKDWACLGCHNLIDSSLADKRQLVEGKLAGDPELSRPACLCRLAEIHSDGIYEVVAAGLESDEVAETFILGAAVLADKRLYEPLWEFSWSWEGDALVMQEALDACRWDDPRDTTTLIEVALRFGAFEDAEEAVGLLQRRGGDDVFAAASQLCYNQGTQSRWIGARILGRLGSPFAEHRKEAVKPLLHVMEDPNDTLVATAITSLEEVADADLVAAVKELQEHDNPEVRKAVKIVLYGLQEENSITGMTALATAREGMVRVAAAQALDHVTADAQRHRERGRARVKARETVPGKTAAAAKRDTADHRATRRSAKKRIRRRKRSLGQSVVRMIAVGLLTLAAVFFGMTFVFDLLDVAPAISSDTPRETAALLDKVDGHPKSTNERIRNRLKEFDDNRSAIEAKRIMRFKAMLEQPLATTLSDSKDAWFLYNRLDLSDSALVVAQTRAPTGRDDPAWNATSPLVELITEDIDGDNHARAARFLHNVSLDNPQMASNLIHRSLDAARFFQRDDLAIDFALLADDTRETLRKSGYNGRFHPAVESLDETARKAMAVALRSGWTTSTEAALAAHLGY